jgi:hypothetical protein
MIELIFCTKITHTRISQHSTVILQPEAEPIDKPIENPRSAKDNNIQCTKTGSSVICSGSSGTTPEAARDEREVLEHADEF